MHVLQPYFKAPLFEQIQINKQQELFIVVYVPCFLPCAVRRSDGPGRRCVFIRACGGTLCVELWSVECGNEIPYDILVQSKFTYTKLSITEGPTHPRKTQGGCSLVLALMRVHETSTPKFRVFVFRNSMYKKMVWVPLLCNTAVTLYIQPYLYL